MVSFVVVLGSAQVARADPSVVVVVESSHASVSATAVREQMRASGVGAMGAADAPAGPIASLAIVFRGPGEETRFRLRTLDGRVVVRDVVAPANDVLPWLARRACRIVRVGAPPVRVGPAPRGTTEVLNPWDNGPGRAGSTGRTVVVNPWDDEEDAPRRRRHRRRSVGRVAGATVARYSEVLDPWSQASGRDAEVVDPWAHAEGGEGLAPPARRRRDRRRRR